MKDPKNPSLAPVLLSLGSNIDPERNILSAVQLLSEHAGQLRTSSIWESPAVGSSGPNYLNCTALFQTDLSPPAIKSTLISPIENQLGRIRTADKYIDRTIDLDILIYDNQVIDPELWTQAHLALPASELMPDFIDSETGETLLEAAARLQKSGEIFQRLDLN